MNYITDSSASSEQRPQLSSQTSSGLAICWLTSWLIWSCWQMVEMLSGNKKAGRYPRCNPCFTREWKLWSQPQCLVFPGVWWLDIAHVVERTKTHPHPLPGPTARWHSPISLHQGAHVVCSHQWRRNRSGVITSGQRQLKGNMSPPLSFFLLWNWMSRKMRS